MSLSTAVIGASLLWKGVAFSHNTGEIAAAAAADYVAQRLGNNSSGSGGKHVGHHGHTALLVGTNGPEEFIDIPPGAIGALPNKLEGDAQGVEVRLRLDVTTVARPESTSALNISLVDSAVAMGAGASAASKRSSWSPLGVAAAGADAAYTGTKYAAGAAAGIVLGSGGEIAVEEEHRLHQVALYAGVAIAFFGTIYGVYKLAMMEDDAGSDGISVKFTRWFYPFILLNLGVLVAGHITNYLHIDFTFSAPGLGVQEPIQDLNFVTTVYRSATSGCYLMAFVICAGVIVWPYMKLLACTYCVWRVQSKQWSKEYGYRLCHGLNSFSKWAFAEVFVFSYTSVMLNMHGPPTDVKTVLNGYPVTVGQVTFRVFLKLVYGAIILVYAIVLSVFLTHWAESELSPGLVADPTSDASVPPPGQDRAKIGGQRRQRKASMALWFAIAAAFFLMAGVSVPVMHVHRDGTLGRLMQSRADTDMSVINMVTTMLSDEVLSRQALIRIIAVIVGMLTICVPFAELVLLAVSIAAARETMCEELCFLKISHWCKTRAEVLSAFDCVDVFLLMGLVVLVDISDFVVVSTRAECGDMESLYKDQAKLESYGLGFAYADGRCIDIGSHLHIGWLVLLGAVLLRAAAWRLSDTL